MPIILPKFMNKDDGQNDICTYPFQLTVLSAFGLRCKVIYDLFISLKETADRIIFKILRMVCVFII